ncbi:MAG TPA: helix-turn-helix transcriptional regulator [Stellaceae bacterium]|jgi:DNA-binding CsgD family transcriptional regulator|nr:helix-turn-helix transcriptional regulator [Stellaceae bacterium]
MVRNRDKLVLELIERIYAASLDKAQWRALLSSLAEIIGGAGAIFSQDTRTAAASIFDDFGFVDGAMANYVAHFTEINPWLPQVEALKIPVGKTIVDEDLIDTRSYEGNEFYNDWVRPQDLYYMIAGVVLKDKTLGTNLTFLRPRAAGPYRSDEIELFNLLLPHVARAAQIHRHLFTVDLTARASEQALDGLEVALLIVDRQARIRFANGAAERMLRQATGIQRRDDRLRAASPRDSETLQHTILRAADTAAGKGIDAGGVLPIRRAGNEPLMAMVSPLLPDKTGLGTAEPAALVLISDPSTRARPREEDLARLFGLTPAEAMLLAALVDGERVNDFAARKGISLATVKTQLQSIFGKTGQSRQSDLMRLVLSNPLFRLRP